MPHPDRLHLVTDADGIPVGFTDRPAKAPGCPVPWCITDHTGPDQAHLGALHQITDDDPDTGEITAAVGAQLHQLGDRFAPFVRLLVWQIDEGGVTCLLDRAEALALAEALTTLAHHLKEG